MQRLDLEVGTELKRDTLFLSYHLSGTLDSVILDPPSVKAHELWKHTCFEFFLRLDGESYLEFNFSPSGQFYTFQFDRYRETAKNSLYDMSERTKIVPQRSKDSFRLNAQIDLPFAVKQPVKGSLTSVVELSDHTLTYWAVNHTRKTADFHAPESFFTLGI